MPLDTYCHQCQCPKQMFWLCHELNDKCQKHHSMMIIQTNLSKTVEAPVVCPSIIIAQIKKSVLQISWWAPSHDCVFPQSTEVTWFQETVLVPSTWGKYRQLYYTILESQPEKCMWYPYFLWSLEVKEPSCGQWWGCKHWRCFPQFHWSVIVRAEISIGSCCFR